MEKIYKVVIPASAKESLREIIQYIKLDSPSAAKNVRLKLLELAKSLSISPERFSRESFLESLSGNYRSVVLWHYKIIYKVQDNEVVILRFIHTSRDPEEIKKLDRL